MQEKVISIESVTKEFVVNGERVVALDNVSVSIDTGSFTVIHGHSGSGKSTLLDTIVGLQEPSTGKVLLKDADFYSLSPSERASLRARFFGVVYQRPYWIASMNVTDNVAYPLFVRGMTRKRARQKAHEVLEQVGLERFAKYDAALLSGGQQQRVTMARALVTGPSVIVADEPTGNLDRANSDHIIEMLQEAHDELGKTVILVTHNLEFLKRADHVISLEGGQMTERRNDVIGA